MRPSTYVSVRWRRPDLLNVGVLAAALAGSVAIGQMVTAPTSLRLAVFGAVACAALGLAFVSPRALLFCLVIWLTMLGLLRRIVSLRAGSTGTDPLLLIGPLVVATLVLIAADMGAFKRLGTLGKSILVLSGLTILGALNPSQGSLRSGAAGLLFVLLPMLAFWIGRALVDDRMLTSMLSLLAGLAIPAALYGLWQTFVGFPAWDARWFENSGFAALSINETIRPFSAFSSPEEFGFYLAVGIITWLTFAGSPARLPLVIVVVALLGTALVYESSRTTVVLLVAALGIAFAARWGIHPAVALGIGATFVVALSLAASHFAKSGTASSASSLVAHDTQGLANPLGSNSTALTHLSLVVHGIRSAFSHPVGTGVGSVTIASGKFGGVNQSTEADPSNVAVALGLPGLATYVVVLITGLRLLYQRVVQRRDALATAALAVALGTTFEWLNGGMYSVALLPWLILGWADSVRQPPEADPT